MTGNEIRAKFLDYFASQGHRIVRSSSLVPANDPTLLFANAGMNQFKDVFTGLEKRDYTRAASAQKCVRAGGKHNDLDNVGYTRRHQTFFEMLGNFSFGDYFKKEAIAFAWELLTRDFGLAKDRLYISVFREDDDAERLWQEVAGVPKDRIFRLDEADNFWQMGDTGPCGPCSEIYYDFGPEAGPGRMPDDPAERFVEIWNLVFMQFDRSADGKMTPLPRPSIDTGMGLERITCALQGKLSNYETDLLRPIIDRAAEMFGLAYGDDPRTDIALRINADHSRATAFLIHDGVLASNEGRGYVLRKIMRRAIRNARMIGRQEPYLYELTGFVADLMKPGYPELMESIQRVARVVKDEEHRYATTFQVAEKVFVDEAKSAAGAVIPGPVAFKLYDTYGLALDEQDEMARERGLTIDHPGFEAEMEKQRTRARASWKGGDKAQIPPVYRDLPSTEFIGRETLEAPVKVVRVIEQDGKTELVLDRTPFYAEAGGQATLECLCHRPQATESPSCATPTNPLRAPPSTRSRRGLRSARATNCSPASIRTCATPLCATIPPRICCMRPCGRCSARTSSRPAALWTRIGCALTSRITRIPIPRSWPRSSGSSTRKSSKTSRSKLTSWISTKP
jgi:alanyl-tRNA synthetase